MASQPESERVLYDQNFIRNGYSTNQKARYMIKILYRMATQPIRACDIIYDQNFILNGYSTNQGVRYNL